LHGVVHRGDSSVIIPALAHGIILKQRPILKTPADAWVSLLGVAATLGLAGLSWRFFEGRLVRYGHTFKYRFAGQSDVSEP
jgi:peptidoglycan/LPS O-acetylase OafA/YrhL